MVTVGSIFFSVLFALTGGVAQAQDRFLTVASTTSTEQSGLFGFLLPIFEKESGIKARVVALGTGQALDLARRAMLTSSSSTRRRPRKSSSPRATASSGTR